MGDMVHRTVIITGFDDTANGDPATDVSIRTRVGKVKEQLPEHLLHLFIGPFQTGVNDQVQYFFITSGSYVGRGRNIQHAMFCNLILEEFRGEAILVTHGEVEPTVTTLRKLPKRSRSMSKTSELDAFIRDLRQRLEGRIELNSTTAKIHPVLEARLLSEGRVSAYKTVLEDLEHLRPKGEG